MIFPMLYCYQLMYQPPIPTTKKADPMNSLSICKTKHLRAVTCHIHDKTLFSPFLLYDT